VPAVGKPVLTFVVCALLTVSACGGADSKVGGERAPGVSSSPSTTAVPPRTTTSIPDFSFDDSVPPPKIVNTGTDYVAILKSLESYGNWLGAHRPEPALASRSVSEGTRLHRDYVSDITILRDNHKREIEKRIAENTVTILSATPNAFTARVVEHISAHQIVDVRGHVSSERRFKGPTTYIDLVVREGERWRLADVRVQT
jgi:hypothetical protein